MRNKKTGNNPTQLQVLICTLGAEGLERVGKMTLPRVNGVGYLVACQSDTLPLPENLQRDDIEVHFNNSRGLSRNRNFAFSKASAQVALIADDDLTFSTEGLRIVIDTFNKNPDIDIATFRCEFPFKKDYPDTEISLRQRIKNYYVTSYEIAVRMSSVRKCRLQFCENMGIGADLFHSGEESVFIDHAIECGLECRFFPFTIVKHTGIPTGRHKKPSAGVLRADGVLIARHYKWSILPRLMLKAWRCGGNFFSNLSYLTAGAIYFLRHPEEF